MNRTIPVSFLGMFQVWSYSVSHGTLLLRSTKSEFRQTQIDVLLKDVGYVQLPTTLHNLKLEQIASIPDLHAAFQVAVGRNRFVYRFSGSDYVGYVVAGVAGWVEGDQEYYDESPLLPTLRNE